jgi:predicted small secreted protein
MNIRRVFAWFSVLFIAVTGAALGGCNTVEGVGQDVEALGDSIEDAARDND